MSIFGWLFEAQRQAALNRAFEEIAQRNYEDAVSEMRAGQVRHEAERGVIIEGSVRNATLKLPIDGWGKSP